jgi:hypothetical protein
MSSEATIRVSDAERDAVLRALADHHAAGRLDLAELEQRVEGAYRAVTRADLDQALVDLPAPARPTQPPATRSGACARAGGVAQAWLVTTVVCLTVWALTSFAGGEATYFWPVWVLGPWGLALAARKLTDGRAETHG